MTGNSILIDACAHMHETDISIYEPYALPWLATVLTDVLDVNNSIRESKGLEPLALADILVRDIRENLNVEDELHNVLMYGVLVRIMANEDDKSLLNTYMQQYDIEKHNATKAKMRFVTTHEAGRWDF